MTGKIHSTESFGTVDGPGVRFVIFTQGCPLRCLYCHNPDTWEINAGTEMTVQELLEKYEKNAAFYKNGGITVTGGEPLLQIDFIIELFTNAKKKNIHTCLDTSGITFTQPNEKFDTLVKVTDLVMLDIKHIDNQKHKELCGLPNKNVLAFANYLNQKNVQILVRHVVVPTLTDQKEDLFKLGEFLGNLPMVKALDALPYHKLGISKYEQLNIEYPLKDLAELPPENAKEARKIIIQGMAATKAKLKK